MEQLLFERPREKLQSKGAAHLSTIELVQVILGSGNAQVSGARLAKRVEHVLREGSATLGRLIAIEGIGFAKACQIIAALELGARVCNEDNRVSINTPDDRAFIRYVSKTFSKKRHGALMASLYDGTGRELLTKDYESIRGQLVIRKVSEDALRVNARSMYIAVSGNGSPPVISADDLATIKQLNMSLITLGVQLQAVYVASKQGVEKWKI